MGLHLVDREERRSGGDCPIDWGVRRTESGQDFGPKKREPPEEQAEVVGGGGEDGVDGIAAGMGEIIAVHPMLGFDTNLRER